MSAAKLSEMKLATALLANDRAVRFRVIGGSMEPTIKTGESVLARRATPNDVRFGDLVVIDIGHGFVTHRFFGWSVNDNGEFFRHKGDRGFKFEQAGSGQLVAKVTHISRTKGHLALDSAFWKIANPALGVFHLGLVGARRGLGAVKNIGLKRGKYRV